MSRNEFKHYGILRKSGRYPWGSGKDAYQRSMDFYAYVDSMKKQGLTDKEIAVGIGEAAPDDKGYSIADLRDTRTIAKEQIVLEQTNRAKALKEKNWSVEAIAKDLGIPAPTVRLRLKQSEDLKKSALTHTADVIRQNVDKHDIVDLGKGVAVSMGISNERLRAAASVLRDEGYETYNLPVRNPGTKHSTNTMVIVKPGTGFGNTKRMTDKIHTMGEHTDDDGVTYFGIHPPRSVSASRILIQYSSPEDGIIHVRPNVDDLSLGGNHYAQVRVAVDNSHYAKGVAIYKDDIPDGYDMVVHSNKPRGTPVLGPKNNTVLKPMEDDPQNPFGSSIKRQIIAVDPKTGKEKVTSAMNIVNEIGDWEGWRKSQPSQFLAKQPHSLIKSQLQVTRDETKARLDEINSITNAVIRKKRLQDYADQIDADAVDLRAASMPGQKTQVIIPAPTMRKAEVYAPQFKTGERLVLIRYPHGGRFEIPEVTVNNNNRGAKKLLGNALDAIGIHPSVAERLSGADFDGDTVIAIPNPKGTIKGVESLGRAKDYYERELNSFNAKIKYGGYEVIGTKTKKDGTTEDIGNFDLMKNTGKEMGVITNLITDMSIQGAKPEHVVRAVRHSMVVIDAEKHRLNYKQSALDNGITDLKKLYQTTYNPDDGTSKTGGATTLLSKATAKVRVDERKLRPAAQGGAIDPETGALVYVPTGRTNNKYDPKTKTYDPEVKVKVQEEVKRLALEADAYRLVRDPNDPVESMYASHANSMKAMANAARLQAAAIPNPRINPDAKKVYAEEIATLKADLRKAQSQKPLDRKANVLAGALIKQKMQDDPLLRTDPDRKKKVERDAKRMARLRLGLSTPKIDITDTQWDAIQSGAVSASRLRDILEYADPKRIEALSLPRTNTVMTSAVNARAKAMLAAGATNADVAAALGIPASTLREAVRRGDV